MDDSEIEEIWCELIPRWATKLKSEHATPICLIGIGHDHKSGQVTICVPEDFNDYMTCGILKAALIHLKKVDPYKWNV